MKPILTTTLSTATLAPTDIAGSGAPSVTVAEVVRFRLADGVTDGAFLNATHAMQPAVEAAPGYVSRRLSKGSDGMWTDYVIWTDLAHALAAPELVFADPAAQAFGAAIDADSVEMRHEPVVFSSGAP